MGSWIWVVELLCDIKYRIEMIPSDDVAIGIDCKDSEILVALYIIYVTLELKVASAKAWSHFDWITFLRFPINRAMMMHCIAKKSFDFCTKINIARSSIDDNFWSLIKSMQLKKVHLNLDFLRRRNLEDGF